MRAVISRLSVAPRQHVRQTAIKSGFFARAENDSSVLIASEIHIVNL
jgi:hypothetical protein